jgi:drug/metabolite transporter (DMT)-like permease
MSFKTKVFFAFAAVYLIWGSTYLAIRFTIETMPPLLTAGFRFFLAGLVLYSFARGFKKEPAPALIHWRSAFITGGLLLLGGNGNVVMAQRVVPSGLASLMIATTPLWMVLLQWALGWGQRPSWGVMIGIVLGLAGVWFLLAPDLIHLNSGVIPLGGALMLLTAALLWSMGSLYSRKAPVPSSPWLSTGMQMIAGGGLLFGAGLCRGEAMMIHPSHFSFKSLAALMYLLFVGSLIGFTAYIWLLNNVGVARTSTYAFVNPVVAVLLGWAFAGEKLTSQTGLAAVFIILAVVVITINQTQIPTAVQVRKE